MPQDEDAAARPTEVIVQEDKCSGIAISSVAGRTGPIGGILFIMMASLMLGITLMSPDTTIILVAIQHPHPIPRT